MLVGNMIAEPEFDDGRCYVFFFLVEKLALQEAERKQIAQYFLHIQLEKFRFMQCMVLFSKHKLGENLKIQINWRSLLSTDNIFRSQKYILTNETQLYWKTIALLYINNNFYKNFIISLLACVSNIPEPISAIKNAIKALSIASTRQYAKSNSLSIRLNTYQLHKAMCILGDIVFQSYPSKQQINVLNHALKRISEIEDCFNLTSTIQNEKSATEILLLNDLNLLAGFLSKINNKPLTQELLCNFENKLSDKSTRNALSKGLQHLRSIAAIQ